MKKQGKFWLSIILLTLYLVLVVLGFNAADSKNENIRLAHQWLALVVAAVIIYHVAIHWKWIKVSTKNMIKRSGKEQLENYITFLVLSFVFIMTFISGMIAANFFDVQKYAGENIVVLHHITSKLTIGVVIWHVAIHFKWYKKFIMSKLKSKEKHLDFEK